MMTAASLALHTNERNVHTASSHAPVMLDESMQLLHVQPKQWYLDATFGRGGHTRAILQRGGYVVACDCDEAAVQYGQQTFAHEIKAGTLRLLRVNFEHIASELVALLTPKPDAVHPARRLEQLAGALYDLGVSSPQLADMHRGISFRYPEAVLDMRMDQRLGVQAKDLLALLDEKQLAQLFIEFGGEHEAKRIAQAVVKQRVTRPITTVGQLSDLVAHVKRERQTHLHPATKVFQALRIAVNRELDVLTQSLQQVWPLLQSGARLITISFHEGEDRIVKMFVKGLIENGEATAITKKPLQPSAQELEHNLRARSAKLRAVEKVQKGTV